MDKFVPKSVLERLVVGAHVRYVPPDEECTYLVHPKSYSSEYDATPHETFTEAEGKTGVIRDTSFNTLDEDHTYLVQMDSRYRFGGKRWASILVAAYELALVEEE